MISKHAMTLERILYMIDDNKNRELFPETFGNLDGVERPDDTKLPHVISRDLEEMKAASVALQRSHDELELQVEERTDELSQANLMIEEEIADRRCIERQTRASNQVLRLMADASSRQDFLDGVVELVKEWTECRCVGIRILDSEGNIPYGAYTGFDGDFWSRENWLSITRDNCACTRVIAGKPEPQDACCMTQKGSFLLNDARELVESLTEEEMGRFRGVCIQSGFLSVAVIPIRDNGDLVGGIHLADERAGIISVSKVELLEGLSRLMGEGIIKFNAKDALEKKQELLRNIVDHIPVMLCSFDANGNPLLINPEFERILGWTIEDAKGTDLLAECYPNAVHRPEHSEYMAKGINGWREFSIRARSGEIVDASWCNVSLKDGSHIGIGIDLRERKRAQMAMERANRALRVLSESNYALVQDREEKELLAHVCRIIAETGGYPLAWVGYAEENESRNVRPVAKWGQAADYVDTIQVSWADTELGRGPIGRAIREGRLQIAKNFRTEPALFPWRDAALTYGLHSNATFPLILHEKVIGALIIYSFEVDVFHENEEEVKLLSSLASNLAYGVDAIRIHKEHERAEEELKNYMRKLQESNQALQDFASIASHDMQEPLRKILSFGKILNEQYGPKLGDQGNDFLKRMQSSAERMQNLLTALLNYARVTTRANPFVPIDLLTLTQEVLDDLEVRISQTGGRVELGSLPHIEADPLQMHQLLQNLIGNALKYHGEKEPVVRLYGEEDGELATIFVKDNGIGFDEKYLDRIFRPMERLHGRGQYEGTGMGLAICKKIVERHGGSITARSAPGEGTTFVITVPAKQQAS